MKQYHNIKELITSKEFFKSLMIIFIIFFALGSLINSIVIYGYGIEPNISFTSLIFTLLSLAIASYAVIIAINSDDKMKSIATGGFYDLANRFWDRAPRLYDNLSNKERDTESWQLGNLFRHGDKLKKWAELDVQERLIKEFTTFLDRLKHKPCVKYYVEVKNYISISKTALGFKTEDDNVKNDLINELEQWIGSKNNGETNIEYLQRKTKELKKINNDDVYEK
jgi:hypothetical protein